MENQIHNEDVQWWKPFLFAAMAGGMGWGIRGQYGHETGAMIAGLLVSLTLVYLLAPKLSLTAAGRAIAWGTIAMGFGGSMTYGQTLGLTHNLNMAGNWEALRWGLFGTLIKGGLWIGFAGAFLGMGLSEKHRSALSMLGLMLSLITAFFVGCWLLNSPFDPANKELPWLYFSASWYWEPDATALKPRPEVWGGMLAAYLVILVYLIALKRDILAFYMALWGFVGGAIGFPLGQCLQAHHSWNPAFFQSGFWVEYDPYINWWNMMETTFGTVMGAFLGFGLWLNRKKITLVDTVNQYGLPFGLEWILLAVHLALLVPVEFMAIDLIDLFYDHGLILGLIPIVAAANSRWWPFFVISPMTLLPIAGKTVRQLVYNEAVYSVLFGWFIFLIVPVALSLVMMCWYIKQNGSSVSHKWTGYALLFNGWMYFLLNYTFFHFPFPWLEWTGRTPSGIIFTVCVLGSTVCVLHTWGRYREDNNLSK